MNNLKLFADRISHPSRFCIQFLKMNQIPFEEIKVSLLFGENANHPELPFKQIPVLQLSVENDQRCHVPMTIVQSTTILKYLRMVVILRLLNISVNKQLTVKSNHYINHQRFN